MRVTPQTTPAGRRTRQVLVAATAVAGLLTAATGTSDASVGATATNAAHRSHHVLLLSVDGMHQSDLTWWITTHPQSAIAGLVRRGTEYTRAVTPFPSDSFPGLIGQLTGGNPGTTGVSYDVTYNHALIDPAASTSATPAPKDCAHAALGANVPFDESIDKDGSRLDAGQGLATLPDDILTMTGNPRTLIDPTKLPIDPTTCTRVYPHSYLKVNTVFEVAKAAGLRTAWSDKHPAYEILNGPSGKGVDDLFTPEINSDADTSGHDWTQINALTQTYDHYKTTAVLNEIAGRDHSGKQRVGVPALFGMNFQSVSTAEKLPVSDGQPGGYDASGTVPGPLLQSSLAFVDHEVASMVAALREAGRLRDTTIILSAKHAQSPTDGAALKRIDDGAVLDALNAAWQTEHADQPQPLVAASLNDDGMLLWFSNGNRTAAAGAFARAFLTSYAGSGTGADAHAKSTDLTGAPVAYTGAGLRAVLTGAAAARTMGATAKDPRVPDLVGFVQHGVVYTGKTGKIAEHGGNDPQDRHVPLVVSGAGAGHGVRTAVVETTRIAPTILSLLRLSPRALQAVRIEHTKVLKLATKG